MVVLMPTGRSQERAVGKSSLDSRFTFAALQSASDPVSVQISLWSGEGFRGRLTFFSKSEMTISPSAAPRAQVGLFSLQRFLVSHWNASVTFALSVRF